MQIVILTGAGVSAESGLGTFRDVDGLWTQYDLEDVATPQGFAKNPALVHDFYNARRANCASADPNPGHFALTKLQKSQAHNVTLITQNIDDLHERAGATDVLHMHGALNSALCAACEHRWPAPAQMHPKAPCPACGQARTRPDVVWFGEIPYLMDTIATAIGQADLFAAIGTSGTVYPAAGFAAMAAETGALTVEINLEPSGAQFDQLITGPASQTLPTWVAGLIDNPLSAG